MIGIALACKPELLIADEPTTAVDVTVQAQLLELIDGLRRQFGTSVIYITHNLGLVARYVDRVNIMYAGRIVESARTEEVFANPIHPYTRGLLASVPRLDTSRDTDLIPIPGQPPDLTQLPAGCAFQPRCTRAQERCRVERPALVRLGSHCVACFTHRY
jgi:oligopeptide/dipeptide ABC transporter ATP-binding protein